MKKVKQRKSGEEGPPYKPSWRLFECLTFLQDSIRHREYVQPHSVKLWLIIIVFFRTDTNLPQPPALASISERALSPSTSSASSPAPPSSPSPDQFLTGLDDDMVLDERFVYIIIVVYVKGYHIILSSFILPKIECFFSLVPPVIEEEVVVDERFVYTTNYHGLYTCLLSQW